MSEPTTNNQPKQKVTKKAASASPPIFLSAEQTCKLWAIAVGGQLTIQYDADVGQVMCSVSLESFTSALPFLLDRL